MEVFRRPVLLRLAYARPSWNPPHCKLYEIRLERPAALLAVGMNERLNQPPQ